MGSKRLIAAVSLIALLVAAFAAASGAKVPQPTPREAAVPGPYAGHVRTETFPSLAHPSRVDLAFALAGGEVRRMETTLPLVCGMKELKDAPVLFNYEFGTQKTVGRVALGGSFKVVEQAQVAAPEAPAGTASIRIGINGWFDGATARGAYRIMSRDGSNCRASGVWFADRVSR